MKREIKCPICDNKIEYTSYSDEQGICEDSHSCNQCGYKYDFAYGNYKETINGKEFSYSYNTPFEQMKEYNEEYEKLYKKWKGEL